MKYLIPLLLLGALAACAPGPQEPQPLEPIAPTTMVPETTVPEVMVPETAEPEVAMTPPADTSAASAVPEEPTITVIPANPEGATSGGDTSGGSVIADPKDPGIATTIGISADNQTFVSATDGGQNPLTLSAGSTFYLQVKASDPDGVSGVRVELRNSDASGPLPTGPFSVVASDCDAQVASSPTELTCTVTVAIAPDATNITQAGETAYAFRPRITDAVGNSDLAYSWGYLIIE